MIVLSSPINGQMPMLNPTAALLDNLLGLAPCFKYDQNGSVTCAYQVYCLLLTYCKRALQSKSSSINEW